MTPASTHAPRADADFDLDVRLSPVIRHVSAGAVAAPPTDAGCPDPATGSGSCANVSGCVPPVCFVPKRG